MGQRSTAEPWIGSVNGLSVEEGTMEGLNRGISRGVDLERRASVARDEGRREGCP